MDELDLFGIRGGPPSVIHVMADELQKCKAVLEVSISGLTNFNRNFERGIIRFRVVRTKGPNLFEV